MPSGGAHRELVSPEGEAHVVGRKLHGIQTGFSNKSLATLLTG